MCTHKSIKMHICSVHGRAPAPEPNPPCSARALSPLCQPCPTAGHSWGPRWPSSHPSAQPGTTAGAQGSHLPPGMNYRAINHTRLSGSVLCLPSIRRHKQLCSQQDWQKERQKGDPGDLRGVLVGVGVLGTFVPVCPKLPRQKIQITK